MYVPIGRKFRLQHDKITIREHLGSSPVFGGVRVLHLFRILCSVVCLCFVCPRAVPSMSTMLPVSLDCSFLISHSVFS
jgi:hypothetical protein